MHNIFGLLSLNQVEKKLDEISVGDLSKEINESKRKRGLMKKIHQTSKSLVRLIISVDRGSKRLDQEVLMLGKNSEIVNEQVNTVTTTIRDITNGIQDAAEYVQTISTEMCNINDLLNEVKTDNQSLTNNAMKYMNELVQSKKETTLTMEQIRVVSEDKEKVHQSMNHLDQSISHISSVSTLLSKLSNETHILSLNANIVASQAGEHGKAFQVIANEVSILAQQSKEEITKIQQQIQDISDYEEQLKYRFQEMDTHVEKSVLSMQESIQKYEYMESFLLSSINNIDVVNNKINNISTSTHNSVQSTNQTNAFFQEIAAGSEEMLASSEIQLQSINQMNEDIQRMKLNSLSLRSVVSQFKTPIVSVNMYLKDEINAWIDIAIMIRAIMLSMIESTDLQKIREWNSEKELKEEELSKTFKKLSNKINRESDKVYLQALKEAWAEFSKIKDQNAKWMLEEEFKKASQALKNEGRKSFKIALDIANEWLEIE
ncbi:methyl-accepting chemotaxis protein [Chengkuizengella sediminis]|uniref:methyl-accepting chemotaxis protein n=1 Tax=Chengkuizengella sediminis TaxID=1885917 RepID=UPI0013899ED3|nr:methyl-accepting chemotaxis protein [Chengkuizengella sediminis]NDI36165.1 hypothetical protein [Chengkuizengella sediminis]